eukprot:6930532-Pyramimonas_sp.AAC.2
MPPLRPPQTPSDPLSTGPMLVAARSRLPCGSLMAPSRLPHGSLREDDASRACISPITSGVAAGRDSAPAAEGSSLMAPSWLPHASLLADGFLMARSWLPHGSLTAR